MAIPKPLHLALGAVLALLAACGGNESTGAPDQTAQAFDLAEQRAVSLHEARARGLRLVKLRGKIAFFGYDLLQSPPQPRPYQAGVPGAKVWIAEFPITRYFNVRSDSAGYWTFHLVKPAAATLELSFLYEKDFYPPAVEKQVFPPDGLPSGWDVVKIKSNVYAIGNDDVLDIAVQMPDELYLNAARMQLEAAIGGVTGQPYAIQNILVSTVGKSWASLFDERLPHGDPGATVSATPAPRWPTQGPIYFNESVSPDPTRTSTSVDGGVLFDNLPAGLVTLTASQVPFAYQPVRFRVDGSARLFISSPPHSLQSSNGSGPGLP